MVREVCKSLQRKKGVALIITCNQAAKKVVILSLPARGMVDKKNGKGGIAAPDRALERFFCVVLPAAPDHLERKKGGAGQD